MVDHSVSEAVVADHAAAQFTEVYPSLSSEGIKDFYDGLDPRGYDDWLRRINFTEPYHVVDEVARLVNDPESGVPATAKVLDVGAGTGILGVKLREKGCRSLRFTAIDGSTRFVTHLKSVEEYEEARELFMGNGDDAFPSDLHAQYDVVISTGCWMKSHIPAPAMDDCVTALRPNGYFVTAMRSLYYDDPTQLGYRLKLDELVATGKLSLVATHTFMRGDPAREGLFAPMESRLLCYKRIN